ncbi:MAG: LL-diaminopimelate aminotransferase, partial [Verrucomicrobia bacterium]|nr:LL-diaminopimelate aminotransferase [Verrucomicrobiota bacterium]
LIRCGIGDVTEPLPPAVIEALHRATDEMADRKTFHGYGPEQGYEFLRSAIVENDYRRRGINIADDEVFVSDGSKCDGGNILDILGHDNRFAVMDPVYPVYVDTNVMAGHTGGVDGSGAYTGLVYLPCTAANGFTPSLPTEPVDVIYLCYPNNPTGVVGSRDQLTRWVKYAEAHDAIILFDAAYEAYIQDPDVPHSIFEIPGATECAIEFRSFSKNGGFTGLRCAFTILPKAVKASTATGEKLSLHPLWHRRFSTKFNGVSYPVQRAATAVYSENGRTQVGVLVAHYLENARILRQALEKGGLKVFGGQNAPYLWVAAPSGYDSWSVFDKILREIQVVITPGVGFGREGEGYFRVSAFNSRENAVEVARRFQTIEW